MANPSPVPCPSVFVVKNGSKSHLLELVQVDQDLSHGGAQVQDELDLLSQNSINHFARFIHHLVQVEQGRLENLLAPESRELAGENSRPLWLP